MLTEEQPPKKKCKLKANQIEEQQKLKTELLQKAVHALSVPPGYHKETSEKTTGNRFGSYVAQTLDGFSSHGRAIAEKRISDVLFEVECEEHNYEQGTHVNYNDRTNTQIQNTYASNGYHMSLLNSYK